MKAKIVWIITIEGCSPDLYYEEPESHQYWGEDTTMEKFLLMPLEDD